MCLNGYHEIFNSLQVSRNRSVHTQLRLSITLQEPRLASFKDNMEVVCFIRAHTVYICPSSSSYDLGYLPFLLRDAFNPSIRSESFPTEYKTLFLGEKRKKKFNKHPNCLCLPSNFGFKGGNSATTPTEMPVITARFSEPFLNRNTQQPDRDFSLLYCGMPVFC